jgi:beta-lactamase regulating signal transducer with metallopeptidase domain
MANYFVTDVSMVWAILWQTTLLLLVGLAASWLWARQPARAHCLLMLTMFAAVLTPCASVAARYMGWGFWAAAQSVESSQTAITTEDYPAATIGEAVGAMHIKPAQGIRSAPLALSSSAVRLGSLQAPMDDLPNEGEPQRASSVGWSSWLAWLWMALTAILLGRLALAVRRGWGLLAGARLINDPRLADALKEALTRLGIRREAVLYASDHVAGPVIWCWSRRPILLVPAAALSAGVDWPSILCHELAHWKRRDHVTSLVGEMLVALLPVQPLAWWARRRLALLCERSCDDWVLAMGRSPIHYAESLLQLLSMQAESQPAYQGVALAAVSGRASVQRRIRHILERKQVLPAVSRCWLSFALLAMSAMVSVLALAQQRPATAQETQSKPQATITLKSDGQAMTMTASPKSPAKGTPTPAITVAGKVVGPDDKPISEASVVLVSGGHVSEPAKTDKEGKFHVRATSAAPSKSSFVFAWAQSFAPGWQAVKTDQKPTDITLHLSTAQVLRGRLIDLQGQPAAGVKLSIRRLGADLPTARGQYFFETATDFDGDSEAEDQSSIRLDVVNAEGAMPAPAAAGAGTGALPALQIGESPAQLPGWPAPVTTDKDGRFILQGIPRGQEVRLLLSDERYALQTLDIKGQDKGTPDLVTLAVAPPHVIEGVVTDADTGKPIPHARVRLRSPGSFSGTFNVSTAGANLDFKGRDGMGAVVFAFALAGNDNGQSLPGVEVRTDDLGRYRLNLFRADAYTIAVHGPDGEPYLRTVAGVNWSKGAAHKEVNLTLVRGVIVRGKVTEEPSGKPVAGARIDFIAKDIKLPPEVRYRRRAQSGPDGLFQVVLPHGKWHALANAQASVYLWQKIPAGELTPAQPAANATAAVGQGPKVPPAVKNQEYYYPDAWVAFDLQSTSSNVELSLGVRRLMLRGQVVGADGKPAAGATMLMRRMLQAGGVPGGASKQINALPTLPPAPLPPAPVVPPAPAPGTSGGTEGKEIPPAPQEVAPIAALTDIATAEASLQGLLEWTNGMDTSIHSTERVELPDGRFEIPVNDLDATIRVLFQDPTHQTGAVVDFKGKEAESGPVTVRLAPCGLARARFLDAKGKPLAGYRPVAWAMLPPLHPPRMTELGDVGPQGPESSACEIWLGRSDPKHYGNGPLTDAEGWVVFPNLIPGVVYRISQFNANAKDFTAEAGKLAQVGDIRIAKPDESKKLPTIKTK